MYVGAAPFQRRASDPKHFALSFHWQCQPSGRNNPWRRSSDRQNSFKPLISHKNSFPQGTEFHRVFVSILYTDWGLLLPSIEYPPELKRLSPISWKFGPRGLFLLSTAHHMQVRSALLTVCLDSIRRRIGFDASRPVRSLPELFPDWSRWVLSRFPPGSRCEKTRT